MSISKEKRKEAASNHRANMAASLRHRLEVARSSSDTQLVTQLEEEMRQLGLS